MAQVVRAAKVRSGFEQTSTDLGVAKIGEIIIEIESRVNYSGIRRVHYKLPPGAVSAPAPAPVRRPPTDEGCGVCVSLHFADLRALHSLDTASLEREAADFPFLRS